MPVILRLSGGKKPVGTATPEYVIAPLTFSNANAIGLTGTMPNFTDSDVDATGLGDAGQEYTLYMSFQDPDYPTAVDGYTIIHLSKQTFEELETNILPENIKNGVEIVATVGTLVASGVRYFAQTTNLVATITCEKIPEVIRASGNIYDGGQNLGFAFSTLLSAGTFVNGYMKPLQANDQDSNVTIMAVYNTSTKVLTVTVDDSLSGASGSGYVTTWLITLWY